MGVIIVYALLGAAACLFELAVNKRLQYNSQLVYVNALLELEIVSGANTIIRYCSIIVHIYVYI